MKEHGPLLGQVYVQVSYATMYLLTRVALTQGMSHYIYVIYRQIVATLVITPFAYFLESGQSSKLNLKNVAKISLLALFGITLSQNLYYAGLSLTSTTLATAMNNLNPAATFLVAVLLRLERLDLWTLRGQAKVWGTFTCLGGAIIMTLSKGQGLSTGPILFDQLGLSESPPSTWIWGSVLLVGGVWAWSACVIYQAWIVEDCPSQLTSTAVMCWSGTIQSVVVALLFDKDAAWRPGWNLQLLTIIYSGIFCSGLGLFIQMWCVKVKGPVFSTIFSPLSTVLVAILEPVVLHVRLQWGSVAGMVLVIGGLYCVLWGKAVEENIMRKTDRDENKSTSNSEAETNITEPLLTDGCRGERIEI